MKTSKLKYMFAIILMTVVATMATSVQASMPNARVKVSQMLNNQKTVSNYKTRAGIVEGSDGNPIDYQVLSFNSGYSTSDLNPVNNYTILDNINHSRIKAYAYNYENVDANNRVEAKLLGAGYSDLDKRIGLGLTFGLSYLDDYTAENQGSMDNSLKNMSFATQLYIWMVTTGRLDAGTDTAFVSAFPDVVGAYNNIKNAVALARSAPSFAYPDQATAKEHKVELKWNAQNARYEATLTDSTSFNESNLIIKESSGITYSKSGSTITFYTNEQVGSPDNPVCIEIDKAIYGAYYPAYAETVNGQKLVYESNEAQNQEKYYVSFYTNALRVEVQKHYGTHPQNSNVGDAKLEGAVYGVYRDSGCTDLVEEITTDASGKATSRPLEDETYYVKEIAPSEGCKIDGTVHTADKNTAVTDPVSGQKVVKLDSTDNVIYGGMRLTVSVSDLSGHTTKEFAVNSKITVTLDSRPDESYEGRTNEQGYVEFKNIPYGHYTIKEVEKQTPDVDFMDPIYAFINEEKEYNLTSLVNDEVAQRFVRIEKVDAETGKMIPSDKTTFEVWNTNGNQVIQTQHYQEEKVVSSFKTLTENGAGQGFTMLPEKLPYGTYEVREMIAPVGYYNEYTAESKPTGLEITTNTPETPESRFEDVVVKVANKPQKINLSVNTRGDVLTGTEERQVNGYTVYNPSYTTKDIEGAKYRVTANENIVTGDGTIRMNAGESIEFTSKEVVKLYLGSYTLEQIEAPEGYVIDSTPRQLNYQPFNQNIPEKADNIVYFNQRQNYVVNLSKSFKELNFYKKNPVTGEIVTDANFTRVLVGIYAAEDIKVSEDVIISKDTLVDVVRMNADGTGRVAADLPKGSFYAKELETDQNYKVSDKNYEVNAFPRDNTTLAFIIDVENIVNEPKLDTTLTITKVENIDPQETFFEKVAKYFALIDGGSSIGEDSDVDVLLLKNAQFGVYYTEGGVDYPLYEKVNGKFVEVVRTTDKEGKIVIQGLPFGTYKLKELKAPKYYDLPTEDTIISLTKESPKLDTAISNVRTLVQYKATVVDEDGTLIKDATVQIVDSENDMFKYEVVTDENGVADFGTIRAGKYIRKVSTLEKQYVVPEDKTVTISDPAKPKEDTIEVQFVKGNILVYKTDEETGEALPGSKFKVTNEKGEVVAEGETDENGYFYVEGLRYGEYYVEETEAPEGYEKENVLAVVNIEENGKTYEVDITNISTGDIAVALYAMMAIVSLATIVVTVKKLKMN